MASPTYCTAAELYEAFDRRLLTKLSGDGTEGPIDDNNAIIKTSIERASERIQMACTVGERYSEAQLTQMVTDDRWALKELCTQLTIGILHDRRGAGISESIQKQVDRAEDMIERLEAGKRVFPIDTARDAGKGHLVITNNHQNEHINLVGNSDFFPIPNQELF